jgi:hypothetical protein
MDVRTPLLLLAAATVHFLAGFGAVVYVIQRTALFSGEYSGSPAIQWAIVALWAPMYALQPLLPSDFLSRWWGIGLLVANSLLYASIALAIATLLRRWRAGLR